MSWEMVIDEVFVFERYGDLLVLLQNSIWAGALIGLVGGLIGTFVMMRDMAFSVHGIAELSFAGGAIALLIGSDLVTGSLMGSIIAAVIIGIVGAQSRESNSVVGVLMPFGLGVGILALALYQGRSSNRFALLTGQIVSVNDVQLVSMAVLSAVVMAGLLIIWRPLSFASTDPFVAQARGLPVRTLSIVFMLLLGVAVALSVQIIGALLVLALLISPAAAAMNFSASPVKIVVLSVVFAETAMVGGILLALGGALPISPYVTTISFLIWVVSWVARRRRRSRGRAVVSESGSGDHSTTGSAPGRTVTVAGN
ncbi:MULTISPECIES: metal ABC transporter permease [Kocuria]|uniref:Metal ABC transporter permease n=1 Tax=Kocuria subflava TaxID=1736139 RepID=A0A846TWM4_9MICC|nr:MULTISPECIES: metal ABC transporter permease [Kocuria]NKE10074.1 metal ABC transporter permease [Kocuria subflava]